ncbi:probable N-octanoylanthranilate hydrolase AqdA2 [Schistocerca americana]|uniref:probable N-octanoylanthranilate hydrolase AqdA2 n=1 Tax=Schistocerca americana TaxID=7009 RepID=UPI001F4F6135|nr:probable N-octanoylanthranilate hydrolase AqdA2 [Schistocerca americana]
MADMLQAEQAPQPAPSWSGLRDALSFARGCPQNNYDGSEDCLYLNVYVPATASGPYPVMVYIHGGAFTSGFSFNDTPHYFVEKGVMLVTTTYRLGALGFLSLQNDDIPGNAGLKDQVLALQWVQSNIATFGWDPSRVATLGETQVTEAKIADMKENFTMLIGSQLPLPTEEQRVRAAEQLQQFYFADEGFSTDDMQAVIDGKQYLFGSNSSEPDTDPNSNDGKVADLLTTLWTNFPKSVRRADATERAVARADDILVVVFADSRARLEAKANDVLSQMQHCCKGNQLTIDVHKTRTHPSEEKTFSCQREA